MSLILKISIVIGTFIFMEGVAWFTHKYIMHGFLWNLHKSHHKVHKHFFEMNDLFAVIFSQVAPTSKKLEEIYYLRSSNIVKSILSTLKK